MQDFHLNKIEVATRTGEGSVSARAGIGIQILIDGTVYIDGDDYYVNVDSFFEALGKDEAVIEFIGGCHEPACCANGAWTTVSPEAWIWKPLNFRLRWADVHRAATSMLQIIDEHAARNVPIWGATVERIPHYRVQMTLLEARVDDTPSSLS